jgi:AhpD family alkylhydroperoxidase
MTSESEKFFGEWVGRMNAVKAENSEIAKSFGGMFAALMKEGELTIREKELIAVAISLVERCAPCINLHVEKALHAGATRQQILEAAGVAVVMRGGPGYTYLPNVVEAMNAAQAKER